MKRKATLGAMLVLAAAAPAIVAPNLVSRAQAQTTRDSAEFPDVPKNHWAYEAINKLASAGIIEGRDGGVYVGNAPMTRYEFAVAIARLLDKIQPGGATYNDAELRGRIASLENGRISRQEVLDLIAALRTEFADELSRLGVRVGDLEARTDNLERRVVAPPRLTTSVSLLHDQGSASYIVQDGIGGNGRTILNGDNSFTSNVPSGGSHNVDNNRGFTAGKFGYTDFELRLTDRVTDRLSVNAAIRSLGDNQEDAWAGQSGSRATIFGGNENIPNYQYAGSDGGAGVYVREANANVDLSSRSFLGAKGLNLIIGRQRTKVGQGLLYDNDLVPTDQMQAQFNIGPFQISGFLGGVNNNTAVGPYNPYLTSGAVRYFGMSGTSGAYFNGAGVVDPTTGLVTGSRSDLRRAGSGAVVGFPGAPNNFGTGGNFGTPSDSNGNATARYLHEDNESLVRVGFNLFRIAGNPVGIGLTSLRDGVSLQRGESVDLTIPLFNRTIGVEYVRQRQYANGVEAPGKPSAYNITLPVLRSRILDFDASYGKADDDFEYFIASSANPFARTYGEALFDRPVALGAPMINGTGGSPSYMAAKKVYDFKGTLRLLRRLPLDFRYYTAKGTKADGGTGTSNDLGNVFSVGSTFNLSPGLDFEVKYGQYNPKLDNYPTIKYIRFGANVGF
jgi:hypothetical protein